MTTATQDRLSDRPMIRYRAVDDFPGWEKAEGLLAEHIERYRPRTVFEVGSGATPTLRIADVARYRLRYITSDLDADELAKADPAYEARQLDVSGGKVPEDLAGRCDIVFSRMVNEHVSDGRRYHANIYQMLSPGGIAIHAFSTLYTLPFLANYLMPAAIGDGLYNFFAPRDRYHHAKFRAHYSWSRGPTRKSVARLQDLGYQVIAYDGYFGHFYYRKRMRLLQSLENAKSRLLLSAQLPLFCSYATMVLRKPG